MKTWHQPPGAQRQAFKLGSSGFNEPHKCDSANEDTDNVGNVVAVVVDDAGTTAIYAAVLFWLECARECRGDESIFQLVTWWGSGRWEACCLGEKID